MASDKSSRSAAAADSKILRVLMTGTFLLFASFIAFLSSVSIASAVVSMASAIASRSPLPSDFAASGKSSEGCLISIQSGCESIQAVTCGGVPDL